METRTLILTRSYTPHQVSSWVDAVGKLFSSEVQVVEEYPGDENVVGVIQEHRVREFENVARAYPAYAGGDLVIRVPAVMRLTEYHGSVKRGVKFSRFNVFTRDGFRCQYCGNPKSPKELNYDHVRPRHRGGKTVWENIVSSCYPCNSQKRNRTPEEAGMRLLKKPVKPTSLPMAGPRLDHREVHPSWIPYCIGPVESESQKSA